MPCLLVLIGFFFPRLVIVLLALFSNYLGRAYTGLLLPLIGFFILPYTTLAYAVAMNENGGHVNGMYLVLVIVAALVDLGVIGGGARARRVRYVRIQQRG